MSPSSEHFHYHLAAGGVRKHDIRNISEPIWIGNTLSTGRSWIVGVVEIWLPLPPDAVVPGSRDMVALDVQYDHPSGKSDQSLYETTLEGSGAADAGIS